MLIKDKTNHDFLIEKHCENLRMFSREKLISMQDNSFGKKKRSRRSVVELFSSDVTEIAELVLQSAKSYVKVEDMSFDAARERALADYMFWYNNDPEKKSALEKTVYRE